MAIRAKSHQEVEAAHVTIKGNRLSVKNFQIIAHMDVSADHADWSMKLYDITLLHDITDCLHYVT